MDRSSAPVLKAAVWTESDRGGAGFGGFEKPQGLRRKIGASPAGVCQLDDLGNHQCGSLIGLRGQTERCTYGLKRLVHVVDQVARKQLNVRQIAHRLPSLAGGSAKRLSVGGAQKGDRPPIK